MQKTTIYHSPAQYQIVVFPHEPGYFDFAEPSDDEVLLAAGELLEGYNIRIVKELIVDQVDPPRLVPNHGPTELHRVFYQCTIYYTSFDDVDQQLVVYIDMDHAQPPAQILDFDPTLAGVA